MEIEEKLVTTECEFRSKQSKLGENIIWGSCIIFILLCVLPLFSGGMLNEETPKGTMANIILSENYSRLILFLSVPFIAGMTAGIILIKSSVKHIAKSYFASQVEDTEVADVENK